MVATQPIKYGYSTSSTMSLGAASLVPGRSRVAERSAKFLIGGVVVDQVVMVHHGKYRVRRWCATCAGEDVETLTKHSAPLHTGIRKAGRQLASHRPGRTEDRSWTVPVNSRPTRAHYSN